MFPNVLAMLLVAVALNASPAGPGRIQGRVVDQSGLVLPGVTLRLVPTGATAQTVAIQTTATGGDGTFFFDANPGDYRLEAELDGFETVTRELRASESVTLPDLVMSIARLTETTTVVAVLPTEVQPRQVGAPATIAEQVIENAPLRNNRYDDMLPLLPNVVRGPDGLVSVAGARAPQGILLLNGVPASDVATGEPIASVPLQAVETVQVISTGFPAELGPATGGVTVINTRAGGDQYKFAVNSFTPRPRLAGKSIQGIEAWSPNTSFRGPIAKGRAWFAESLDYHFEKTRAYTVDGTQDRRQHGATSFTQLDVKTPKGHVLTGWLNAEKQHVDAERLSAFNPLGTVPDFDRTAVSAAVFDRIAFNTSTFETRMDLRHQDTSLTPDGTGAYTVGHDVTRGAYFNSADRQALYFEGAALFSRAAAGLWGSHLWKAGASVAHRNYQGIDSARPVTYLRSSLVPAMRVELVGSGTFDASSTQVGAFWQDAWQLNDRFTVNLGVRLDHDSKVGVATFGPRAGMAWRVDEKTTVSAGGGRFASDPRLAGFAFEGFQSRRVTVFDELGAPGASITYRNVLTADCARATARIWSSQVDRRLGAGWQLRLAAHERRGAHEAVIVPTVVGGETVALLSTTGTSRTRSLETTLGYRPTARQHQFYVSYVRAASTGNTNDFGQLESLFRDPRLDLPEMAVLPADVPHRMLAWGLFALPREVTVAPFFDLRTGFPYSAVNDDWSYAEPRLGRRYPVFASLDVVVNKIVTLRRGVRARVGFKLYNIAGRQNGRDIQADIDRSDFARTYNALGRQVRGVFEIIWGGNRK